MARATTIYLVRHGDVENPDQLYYGRLPGFPLSDEGRRQGLAAGEYLRTRAITAIYASPQTRAQETARIIHAALDGKPHLFDEPALNEIYSQYDGATQDEMDRRQWNFYAEAGAQYEQPQDVLARVRRFVQRVRIDHEGEEVVAVSHADPIVFYWMWVLDIELKVENRRILDRYGLADDYPAKASISCFRFRGDDGDERPEYRYIRPY